MKKKKILFHYLIGNVSGGSDHCLYSLLTQLDQSKYELYLLYFKKNFFVERLESQGVNLIPFTIKEKKSVQVKTDKNPVVNKSSSPNKYSLRLFLSSIKIFIKSVPEIIKFSNIILKNNIDIVHANHNFNSDRSVILASIFLRKNSVSHNRGLHNPILIDKYIAKFVDKIICVSNFSKNVYVTQGVPAQKCITIYDGINFKNFQINNIQTEKIIIGLVGRLDIWKGQSVLLNAIPSIVKQIPKIEFQFFGTGPNKNNLEDLVSKLGINSNVKFFGGVSNIKEYVKNFTVAVHTSIKPEPFGMVIIEAMAVGKPVIATNFGGPTEIITNGIDGILIESEDPTVLAEKIVLLVKNPELRKEIGEEARKKIFNQFNLEKTTAQTEQIYEEVSQ